MFIREPCWETSAMDRSKQIYLSHFRSLPKSLERATADRLIGTMLGDDRRFRDANPEEIEALTLDGMKAAVMEQLMTSNLEISIVGDFDEATLDDKLLRYLGTIPPSQGKPSLSCLPVSFHRGPENVFHQQWHLKDSDERAIAIISGPAPNRWNAISRALVDEGATARSLALVPVIPPATAEPLDATPEAMAAATRARRSHPLFSSITLMILTEIINSRLFTTVRDALGEPPSTKNSLLSVVERPSGWVFSLKPLLMHSQRRQNIRVLAPLAPMGVFRV
jgi:hypothetical protein